MSRDPQDMDVGSVVDFGYRKVSPDEKTALVRGVFERVARRYDVMNDLMSFGTHRLFKRMTLEMSGVRPGQRVLDLAGGTGDLSALFAPVVGAEGQVVLADINPHMMAVGRDRLLDRGLAGVTLCQTSAEALPFADATFHCAVIGFGLRNFTDKDAALRELYRVLAPGGVVLILEFSKPQHAALDAAYGAFQALWPGMGKLIAGDAASYAYLVESIRLHPPQAVLKQMLEDAGFRSVEYHNLVGGIAAIHRGVRP
ncbi:MAG: class I SAM-dependent methyltransferase [Pseudomonadales bacterium]|jgi:demethylmenaquinone methyltransferase/2-methoxy-6-polyprenyl-1,4-benzoquinol methylase